ncbi:MAG: NAD(P)H-dependent oxidoreductase [Paracoccaceae bacterium]
MSGPERKILVLFAHPAQRRSEVNVPLFREARKIEGVTAVDLYALYPTMDIDIDAEQARLREHDVIVFLCPFYWYSTPAILKEWQDLVLEYGFAYGSGGTALHGKLFFAALTTGGTEDAYRPGGYNNFTLRELLHPLEQMATLCGLVYLPPFVLFGARSAREQGRIGDHLAAWRRLLEGLRDGSLKLDGAAGAAALNDFLTAEDSKG